MAFTSLLAPKEQHGVIGEGGGDGGEGNGAQNGETVSEMKTGPE